ncbi:MAG: CAP domain-containing protein, partial [Fimbriimonadales bacterium]
DRWGRRADARATEAGYYYLRLGENLAAGQPTWQRALNAWLQSPSHRANMLRPDYREVGVGIATMPSSRYHYAWAQVFGTRPGVYPVIINLDAPYTHSPVVQVYLHGATLAQAVRLSNDGVNWSDWRTPQEWLEWHLPNRSGIHTVYVQLRIGSRIYESHDSIELRLGGQRAEVAREGQSEHSRSPRLLESLRTSVEGTPRGEHIVHQHERVSANTFQMDDLKRIRHILNTVRPRKPDLWTAVEATAQRLGLYR